ncbi:single-stranded DNA-binding protein [Myxococcota bacterium]|nr:single-stranded DNA-binding protein [Myxococcota bacterium]MBU1381166.1 single-stranded DNA-binding protein [Myxococcota bacterium]MBU1496738.1 single-stranded DNA-binding protein [Myxococcota bacterium]
MADGLNKVMLIGHLGADPVHKVTSGNNDVTDLRLATTESWRGPDGNRQEQTEWHRIVVWGKQAIFARDYLKKGSKIYVEGKIRTRKWTDQEGKDHYTTEIMAKSFLFLDSKKPIDNNYQGSGQDSGMPSNYGSPMGADDDDIPF